MFNRISISICICSAFLMMVACGNRKSQEKVPDDLIQPDQMQAILLDVHLAKGAKMNGLLPGNLAEHPDSLLLTISDAHHTDTTTFKKSYAYYTNNPSLFSDIYDNVINALKRE